MVNKILIGFVLIIAQLNAVINLNDSRIDKQVLFSRAIEQGNIDLVKKLIKAGVNVNYNNGRSTPLETAIEKDEIDILRVLIKSGANVNQDIEERPTPLSRAVLQRNIDIVRILLNAGADVNKVPAISPDNDWDGNEIKYWTPLYFAISSWDDENKWLEISELLINSGANANSKFNSSTLLMLALFDTNRVKLLINAGANVNATDEFGNTAFLYAVEGKNPYRAHRAHSSSCQMFVNSNLQENIKLLIDAGADLQIKDINGKTQLDKAFQIACEQGNLEAIEFLQSL